MKKTLIIAGTSNPVTTGQPGGLAAGALGVFGYTDGTHKAFVTADTPDKVLIAQGVSGLHPILSAYMDRANPRPKKVILQKAAAVAGVKPEIRLRFVKTGGSGNIYGTSTYDVWMIRYDVQFGGDYFGQERQAMTHQVEGIFATEADLYTAFAARINSNPKADVVATAASTYIALVPKLFNQTLFAAGEWQADRASRTIDVASYPVTVTQQTALTLESGTYNYFLNLQRRWAGHTGNYNYQDPDMPRPALLGTPGTTYQTYYITVQNANHGSKDQGLVFEVDVETVVAFPTTTGDTAAGLFEAAIEELFGQNFTSITFV